MAYSQCSIMAEGDLSMCSQPSAVPSPEWMSKEVCWKELEIMKGSLKSPQKRRCSSNKSHRDERAKKDVRGSPFNEHLWEHLLVGCRCEQQCPSARTTCGLLNRCDS